MKKKYDGMKYGYICMNCGRTIPYGVNSDGECKFCASRTGHSMTDFWIAVDKIHARQREKNSFENIDDTMVLKELKRYLKK